MGFNAWNKSYERTAQAVNKHVHTTQANHENQIQLQSQRLTRPNP